MYGAARCRLRHVAMMIRTCVACWRYLRQQFAFTAQKHYMAAFSAAESATFLCSRIGAAARAAPSTRIQSSRANGPPDASSRISSVYARVRAPVGDAARRRRSSAARPSRPRCPLAAGYRRRCRFHDSSFYSICCALQISMIIDDGLMMMRSRARVMPPQA